jgi:hypothetical protein
MTWCKSSGGPQVMELLGHLSSQCVVCMKFWKFVLTLFPFFATAVDLADKNQQMPDSWLYSAKLDFNDRIRAKFKILLDHDNRKMFDQSLSKSKALGDMLRFLPGVG